MMVLCAQGQGPVWMNRTTTTVLSPSPIFRRVPTQPRKEANRFNSGNKKAGIVVLSQAFLFPVDPWAPAVDSQSIASQLFAASLFPYLGFLYFINKSKTAPKLTLFGFYFLLAFVGATIPAGIYAKVKYGTSLSNVDWLHGGAESLLALTNIFIVLGLRAALRKKTIDGKESKSFGVTELNEDSYDT